MSWPGPRAPRNTPRISTSIGSGLLPEKTVHAVPVRPPCTWLRGKTPPVEGGGPAGPSPWGTESAAGTGFCARTATGHIRAAWAPASVTTIAARRKTVCFRRDSTSIRVQREGWLRASGFQLQAFSFFVLAFAVSQGGKAGSRRGELEAAFESCRSPRLIPYAVQHRGCHV
jgi:hypothetical protein